MPTITNKYMITQVHDYLLTWIEGFLIDRRARGLTNNTLLYYSRKLKQFNEYAETQAVMSTSHISVLPHFV
jgi:site-specific recombinase XerD